MLRDRILLAPLLIALLLASGGCAEQTSARNVIVISIDTLRADRLGAYGNDAPGSPRTSPSLDAVAADGVVFEDAASAAPWTMPSHASLVTGRYPSGHGLRTVELRMSQSVPTLAATLRDRGFDTAAFVNILFLGGGSGFPVGFDDFTITPSKPSRAGAASEVVSNAKEWLSAHRERPVFLFAHFFDPHSSYHSLPEYEAMFASEEPTRFDGSTIQIYRALTGQAPMISLDEAHKLRRLYDAGIRQLDDELGAFFAWLRDERWLDDTLIVVTSDHGEEFLDHASMLHGDSHYQEMLRVPLILFGAGVPRGRRISTPVSLVDVVPTVLGILGSEPLEGLDGRDLRPLWESPNSKSAHALEDRAIIAETGPGMKDLLRSVRKGKHKLIVNVDTGVRELYDLVVDPLESRNLADENPELVASLVAEIEGRMGQELGSEAAPPMSDEMRGRLEALGYLVPSDE